MTAILTNGYSRLLSKLGRAGRIVSMGATPKTVNYTVQYGSGKRFTVYVPQYDYFTQFYRPAAQKFLDKLAKK